jgi:hypothetical protein
MRARRVDRDGCAVEPDNPSRERLALGIAVESISEFDETDGSKVIPPNRRSKRPRIDSGVTGQEADESRSFQRAICECVVRAHHIDIQADSQIDRTSGDSAMSPARPGISAEFQRERLEGAEFSIATFAAQAEAGLYVS